MSVKAIIFDFDGVILPDSQHVKDTAYHKLFPGHGNILDSKLKVIASRYGGGKGDRTDIIRDLAQELEGAVLSPKELSDRVAQFSSIIKKDIDGMSPLPETVAMLQRLSEQLPLYLASATPEEELKERVRNLGIAKYFVLVHGRPRTKEEIVRITMEREDLKSNEIMLVGDLPGDAQTAAQMGARFIGIKNNWNVWPEETSFPILSAERLEELDGYIT